MSEHKSTRQEEYTEEELKKRFGSVVQFSVKVLRPMDKYPYEREVWSSEIRVPVNSPRKNMEPIVDAWIKSMEGGVELAKAFSEIKVEDDEQID